MADWTSPIAWAVDEKITSVKLNSEIVDNLEHLHDWLGVVGYSQVIADSAGFTTTETTLVTLNVTIPGGNRDIELKAALDLISTVAGDVVGVRIKEGGTTLMERRWRAGGTVQESFPEFSCRVATPASGAHTYTLTAVRLSGTGTITAKAAATNPMYLRADAA
jgi:hypothetical protein